MIQTCHFPLSWMDDEILDSTLEPHSLQVLMEGFEVGATVVRVSYSLQSCLR